jgi:hypothetical protein
VLAYTRRPAPGDPAKRRQTTALQSASAAFRMMDAERDISAALDWDLDRLLAAYNEAGKFLSSSGLRIARSHGEVSICPTHNHTAARTALAQVQAHTQGLKLDAHQAVHQMMTGQPPLPDRTVARRRFVPGHLANLGIADLADCAPSLTDAAQAAFLSHQRQEGPLPHRGNGAFLMPCGQTTRPVTGDTS